MKVAAASHLLAYVTYKLVRSRPTDLPFCIFCPSVTVALGTDASGVISECFIIIIIIVCYYCVDSCHSVVLILLVLYISDLFSLFCTTLHFHSISFVRSLTCNLG